MVSAPSPSASTPFDRPFFTRFGLVAVACAALVYAGLLARWTDACAGGSDTSGYLNHARQLRAGYIHAPPRALAHLAPEHTPLYLYSALGYKPAPDGNGLVPTYPSGLPLMIAGASVVFGWEHAGDITTIAHALAGVLLTFATARMFGLSPHWSLVAATIVAVSPVYLHLGIQAMSDVPALVWTTAAVLAAWRSRIRTGWAMAAGLAFALAVLVRPTNLLAVIPIAVALGFDVRRWTLFVAAGTPGALFFLLHTRAAYGKYLTTGYGETTDLALASITPTLVHYARWLPLLFTPVVFGLLAFPWAKLSRCAFALFALWLFVIFGFYATYYFTRETWWYHRFILPAAPALVVGGLLGAQVVARRWMTPVRSGVLAGVALVFVVASGYSWNKKLHALDSSRAERLYPTVAEWVRQNLPANAVIAAMQTTGALQYYTSFTYVRWDQITPEQLPHLLAALRAEHRPLYATFFPFEIEDWKAFERVPGPWKRVATIEQATIWQWDDSGATPVISAAPR